MWSYLLVALHRLLIRDPVPGSPVVVPLREVLILLPLLAAAQNLLEYVHPHDCFLSFAPAVNAAHQLPLVAVSAPHDECPECAARVQSSALRTARSRRLPLGDSFLDRFVVRWVDFPHLAGVIRIFHDDSLWSDFVLDQPRFSAVRVSHAHVLLEYQAFDDHKLLFIDRDNGYAFVIPGLRSLGHFLADGNTLEYHFVAQRLDLRCGGNRFNLASNSDRYPRALACFRACSSSSRSSREFASRCRRDRDYTVPCFDCLVPSCRGVGAK